jgi:hypothetical protein
LRTALLDADNAPAAEGACVPLDVSACIAEPDPDAQNVCLQDVLNAALDASMRDGLTYDDLEDASEATLLATLHQPFDGTCTFDALQACIAFEVPLDSDDYDIGCAICAGGPRGGVGCTVQERCPFGRCVNQGECALEICAAVLGGE